MRVWLLAVLTRLLTKIPACVISGQVPSVEKCLIHAGLLGKFCFGNLLS